MCLCFLVLRSSGVIPLCTRLVSARRVLCRTACLWRKNKYTYTCNIFLGARECNKGCPANTFLLLYCEKIGKTLFFLYDFDQKKVPIYTVCTRVVRKKTPLSVWLWPKVFAGTFIRVKQNGRNILFFVEHKGNTLSVAHFLPSTWGGDGRQGSLSFPRHSPNYILSVITQKSQVGAKLPPSH